MSCAGPREDDGGIVIIANPKAQPLSESKSGTNTRVIIDLYELL